MEKHLLKDSPDVEGKPRKEGPANVNYNIANYPSDFTLSVIEEMWKGDDIVIPDFQRKFIWKIEQASLLIDSFLCGLPVPPLFFYIGIDTNNENVVIDGQQRIMSIVYFFEGYFGKENARGKRKTFRLTGLNDDSPYSNKSFRELAPSAQRKLKQSILRVMNVRQLSPQGEKSSIYHIFERLNTGGTPLKPQEIRGCLFRGEFDKWLKEANEDSYWRKILGKPAMDKHQGDVELVLRTFSLFESVDVYGEPMKGFMNKVMEKYQDTKTEKSKKFFYIFEKVTKMVVESLGEKPFHLRGPINAAALDSVMCVLLEHYEEIAPSELSARYSNLIADEAFLECTRKNTTSAGTVRDRFEIARKYLLNE